MSSEPPFPTDEPALDPLDDPYFEGKINLPRYNCFVIRKQAYRSATLMMQQSIFNLSTARQVAIRQQFHNRATMTARQMLAKNIRKLGREAQANWKADQEI